MPPISRMLLAALVMVCLARHAAAENPPGYARWERGPSDEASHFPIAVWLQSPHRAARYREAGINTYIGLWKGPTEDQLAELKKAGMRVICSQNPVALRHLDDPTIIGWLHGDEPDNAQKRADGNGYGPPVAPRKIVEDYEKLRAADPSRPVFLNLGQGVAWDGWRGRGVRTNHPEDYKEYVKGSDVVSFDIYPAAHSSKEISGKLEYVARGVERLRGWAGASRPVWNCIECTRINHAKNKATPAQVRCEVWMSIIHGSRGLIYFVHEWKPRFNEAALLADPAMLAEVTKTNRQITALAPVLNSPDVAGEAQVEVHLADKKRPVAALTKHHGGAIYVFAVAMRGGGSARATFAVPGIKGAQRVEVLGEDRELVARDGKYSDAFVAWGVHLYKITSRE